MQRTKKRRREMGRREKAEGMEERKGKERGREISPGGHS